MMTDDCTLAFYILIVYIVCLIHLINAALLKAEVLGLDPREVDVPVVGGHAGVTILPLLSQVNPTG